MTTQNSIKLAFGLIVCAILVNLTKWWEIIWEVVQSFAWLLVFYLLLDKLISNYKKGVSFNVHLIMASGLIAFQSLTVIDEIYSAMIKYRYYNLPANLYYQEIDEGFDLYNGFYWLVLGGVWIAVFIIVLCALKFNGKDWHVE